MNRIGLGVSCQKSRNLHAAYFGLAGAAELQLKSTGHDNKSHPTPCARTLATCLGNFPQRVPTHVVVSWR